MACLLMPVAPQPTTLRLPMRDPLLPSADQLSSFYTLPSNPRLSDGTSGQADGEDRSSGTNALAEFEYLLRAGEATQIMCSSVLREGSPYSHACLMPLSQPGENWHELWEPVRTDLRAASATGLLLNCKYWPLVD